MSRWVLLWVLLIALVLLPFLLFEAEFEALAARITASESSRSLAAGGIFLLLALDVFLPVPSSIVSTAAGVLFGLWQGAAVVWLGMMVGSFVGYWLGSCGANAAKRLVGEDGLARAAAVMERRGDLAIVMCRPVPVLAEASVVFAGLVRMPLARVVRLTALSNLGIALGYAAFGAFSLQLDSFVIAFAGALVLPGLALLISKLTLAKTPF